MSTYSQEATASTLAQHTAARGHASSQCCVTACGGSTVSHVHGSIKSIDNSRDYWCSFNWEVLQNKQNVTLVVQGNTHTTHTHSAEKTTTKTTKSNMPFICVHSGPTPARTLGAKRVKILAKMTCPARAKRI